MLYLGLMKNGFIKQFKHNEQCPIYNVSPSCFGKFLLSWKTYLNLYLKWAMTFRSPHLFFFLLDFLFIYFYFFWKKGDQIFSQHIKVFYLSHYKAHLECSLSSFTRALPLVQRAWSVSSKIFHLKSSLGSEWANPYL